MAEHSFWIVLKGTVKNGEKIIDVKKRLSETLKVDISKLDHFFTGVPKVLKKGLDEKTAQKIKSIIEKTGALCKIVDKSRDPSDSISTDQIDPSDSYNQPNGTKKNCISCGTPIHFSADHCPSCGAAQNFDDSEMQPEPSDTNSIIASRKNCHACDAVLHISALSCTRCGAQQFEKNKYVAGILAIMFGWLGLHKFYLGQVGMGVLRICFFWTSIPTIVGIVEGIGYLTMKHETFARKFEN